MSSFLYIMSRIPCPDLIWRNIFCDYRASPYNCTFANSHRITNNSIHSNKDIIFYKDFTNAKDSSLRIGI